MHSVITILVVDDEDGIRAILSSELTAAGYCVEQASDGDEAIARLELKAYDLVLLDNKMVRVSGMEVLKFIRTNCPGVKSIMITAFADLKCAVEAKKLGAEDFISKPYELEELLSCVKNVLGEEIHN